MLDITEIEHIKSEIVTYNSITNFPKKIDFEFPENYQNIVSAIKTIEISAECILFDSVESVNESKEFSDLEYWDKDFDPNRIKEYWFFGANGQGDKWILHKTNRVYFYDHNNGEISQGNLVDLDLNFEKWLQFAFLNKQLEEIDCKGILTQELKNIYKSKLIQLSSKLAENYPFDI